MGRYAALKALVPEQKKLVVFQNQGQWYSYPERLGAVWSFLTSVVRLWESWEVEYLWHTLVLEKQEC
jgi:hypothetical protein